MSSDPSPSSPPAPAEKQEDTKFRATLVTAMKEQESRRKADGSKLTGDEKKQAVLEIMMQAFGDLDPGVRAIIEIVLKQVIDTIISVDKGELHIRPPKSCLSFCIPKSKK